MSDHNQADTEKNLNDKVKGQGGSVKEGGESAEQFLRFCKQHMYQIISTAACVVLLIVLIATTSGRSGKDAPEDTQELLTEMAEGEEEYQKDAFADVNELMGNYYKAYAAGDNETLAVLTDSFSETEQSYISVFSQYVEEYRNLSCYTKSGPVEGSFIASVYTESKFKDVDTPAPGLETFYLRPGDEGTLVVDLAYGQLNTKTEEFEQDPAVLEFLSEFNQQPDVVKLKTEVQARYEQALASDENLNTVAMKTVPDAMTVWASDRAEAKKKAEEEKKAAEEAAKKAAEEEAAKKAAEEKRAAELAAAVKVYALDKVNVRAKAGETEDVIGHLEKGSQTTRLEDKDGWSRIDYSNGTEGYVKSEFLSTEKPAEQDPAEDTQPADGSGSAAASGSEVVLKDSINIRKSMTTDSDKIATAFPGEKVTVIESYAEGWTKVSYGDKTGYVRTDLLQ